MALSKQAAERRSKGVIQLTALLALWVLAGLPVRAQVLETIPQANPPGSAGSDNYIISFRPGTSQAARAAAVRRAGAALRFNYAIVDAVAVHIPNTNVFAALQREPSVLEIIPDRAVQADQQADGKPGGGGAAAGQVTPEGVQRVGAPVAGSSDGAGIGVAILDTGMDLLHLDLNEGTASFSAFGSSCQDQNKHGTHVAGIVAALNNSIDVVGVAPAARPYCVQVLNAQGSGSDATILAGLDWVDANAGLVNPPIRVVNMSLGRPGSLDDNPPLRDAVKKLYDQNIVVVVSAGNESNREVSQNVPATYPEVFAVASTTAQNGSNACRWFPGYIAADTASYFTTDGGYDPATKIGVTISAPGAAKENINKACLVSLVGILSLKLGGGTTRMSGTSMSGPLVAGIVARMMQKLGLTTGETIRGALRTTYADRMGTAPLDSPTSGYTFDGEREGIAKAP